MSKKSHARGPLENFRRARGFTQAELADLVHVGQQHISRAERAQREGKPAPLSDDVQDVIAVKLGVTRAQVFPEYVEEALTR